MFGNSTWYSQVTLFAAKPQSVEVVSILIEMESLRKTRSFHWEEESKGSSIE